MSNRLVVNFLLLYLRSRSIGWLAMSIIIVYAVAWGWMWYAGDNVRHQLYGVAAPCLIAGIIVGMAPASPFRELDATRPKLIGFANWLALAGLMLLIVLLALMVVPFWPEPTAALILIRNALGTLGVTLIGFRLLGHNLSWAPGLVFGGASAVSSNPDGRFPDWAWQMQLGDVGSSWIWSVSFLFVGLVAFATVRFSSQVHPT